MESDAHSFVVYLYVNGSGSITSVGGTEIKFVCCCLPVIMWFLFGEVPSSFGCFGWATLFYCDTPRAFHIYFFSFPMTMYESILAQMYVFLVLFTSFAIYHEKQFKQKVQKLFFYQKYIHLDDILSYIVVG